MQNQLFVIQEMIDEQTSVLLRRIERLELEVRQLKQNQQPVPAVAKWEPLKRPTQEQQ